MWNFNSKFGKSQYPGLFVTIPPRTPYTIESDPLATVRYTRKQQKNVIKEIGNNKIAWIDELGLCCIADAGDVFKKGVPP